MPLREGRNPSAQIEFVGAVPLRKGRNLPACDASSPSVSGPAEEGPGPLELEPVELTGGLRDAHQEGGATNFTAPLPALIAPTIFAQTTLCHAIRAPFPVQLSCVETAFNTR